MTHPRNILFIMADQLRWDFLSCYGNSLVSTPNIDRLAKEGVTFDRAYCQSPICGPSRMSFYTGRYSQSHGATWNGIPLKVGEITLGDFLREQGLSTWLVGKTHFYPDIAGIQRLGIELESSTGQLLQQCGFQIFDRMEGLYPEGPRGRYNPLKSTYEKYLNEIGYPGQNPWNDWANSAEGENGEVLEGWYMQHAQRPARVAEEHSETAYTTNRALEFLKQHGHSPWCLHLSYIKPHWPYIAPSPYHQLFRDLELPSAIRSQNELKNPHPIYEALTKIRVSRAFSKNEVRNRVLPTYLGLVKQLDDHLGRLFQFLEDQGSYDQTLIVFTSDHGDYLGDHWLGEKDWFHEPSVKIPLIIRDPSPEANCSRGSRSSELVESIDLIPTFIEALGGTSPDHILEGHSLKTLLQNTSSKSIREYAISEYDYSVAPIASLLNADPKKARIYMVTTQRWKYIHTIGYRPVLFDLQEDPLELNDLGDDAGYSKIKRELNDQLLEWSLRHSQRVTRSDSELVSRRGRSEGLGIRIGFWDENEN
ncbi:MAG: sulfatase-like hydrolase/transferase [bacterium]